MMRQKSDLKKYYEIIQIFLQMKIHIFNIYTYSISDL